MRGLHQETRGDCLIVGWGSLDDMTLERAYRPRMRILLPRPLKSNLLDATSKVCMFGQTTIPISAQGQLSLAMVFDTFQDGAIGLGSSLVKHCSSTYEPDVGLYSEQYLIQPLA